MQLRNFHEKLYTRRVSNEFMIVFMIILFKIMFILKTILNKVLREIRTLQRVTNLLMSRQLFQKVMKNILQKHKMTKKKHLKELQIQRNALNAL